MGGDQNAEVPCEYDRVLHFTAKGVLLQIGELEVWLPRSQMVEAYSDADMYELKLSKKSGILTFPVWLLQTKGLL